MSAISMDITAINVGTRVRKDLGDLNALAASIAEHGLLHAVVVKPDGTLIAGERRLRACQQLGWTEIPVRVVDVADLLAAERAEKEARKDFTPSDAVAIARAIDDAMKEVNRLRRSEIGRQAVRIREAKKRGENIIVKNFNDDRSASCKAAAYAVGMSHVKYYNAKRVVEAAEREPEKYGDLVDTMDKTDKVTPAYDELRRRESAYAANKVPAPARHAALRKLHDLNPSREVERALTALDGICHALNHMRIDQLDGNRTEQWAIELKKHANAIARFTKRMRDEHSSRKDQECVEVGDGVDLRSDD